MSTLRSLSLRNRKDVLKQKSHPTRLSLLKFIMAEGWGRKRIVDG